MSFYHQKFYAGRFVRSILFALLLLIFLPACDSAAPDSSPVPVQPTVAPTTALAATETALPTPTPPTPLAVLLTPPGADAGQVLALQPLLAELAAQEGMVFEVHTELPPAEDIGGLRVVVVLPPDPGITELATAYADVSFLGVGLPGLQAGGNLSLIGLQGQRPDQQGFVAGYLAAVITQNWRVGVLSLSDTDEGQSAQQGFLNGVIFYCGLCRPAYPPFFQYPVFASFPGGAALEAQQAAADTLIASAVETVYITPGAAGDELLVYLAQAGLKIIADIEPPDGIQDLWVTSIRLDWQAAVRQIWPALISAEPGSSQEPPLVLADSNENLFSPGRQQFVERLMADLANGFIDTGAAP